MRHVRFVWSVVKLAGQKLRPSPVIMKRGLAGFGLLTLLLVAFCTGRYWAGNRAMAQNDVLRPTAPPDNAEPTDYPHRVVAYIHKNIAITREDLGEYLITRYGSQRIEALVNRKIIEIACRTKGIVVSDLEVENRFKADMSAIGPHVTAKDFEQHILRQFNKSMYEWKEDVLRPKIAMERYCRDRVIVTQEDIQKGFDAKYGPKVQCRMIVLAANDQEKERKWDEARQGEDKFHQLALQGTIAVIASQGGRVPPIHKHFGDPKVEQAAFALKEGQVSQLMQMPDHTWIILKCDKHLPPDTSRKLAEERLRLSQEIHDRKVQEEIPRAFQELKTQANPQIFFREQPMLSRAP